MSVTLSVATSADGYIDDTSSERLVLSTPDDWSAVYALRAEADAIVIGANTLRVDNPRLSLKSEELRAGRLSKGLSAEPVRVVVSGRGYIDPSLRLFSGDGSRVILFSQVERVELEGRAEVIVVPEISATFIVGELERLSLSNIFVEGGAQTLKMFLDEGVADTLRVAVNPLVVVGESDAPRFDVPQLDMEPCKENLGGMQVSIYAIHPFDEEEDLKHLKRAIEISRNCEPRESCYRVGAVVVTSRGDIFEGYTTETAPTHHAEQAAIYKAEAVGADLRGAVIYSSMEPCSERKSERASCSQIIIRLGFSRAVFALYEPSHFVTCHGAENLRRAGITVRCIGELVSEVVTINNHII